MHSPLDHSVLDSVKGLKESRHPHCPGDTASHQSAPGTQPRCIGPKAALEPSRKLPPPLIALLNDPANLCDIVVVVMTAASCQQPALSSCF